MSLKSLVSSVKKVRVLAIDPSSHSLAWAIVETGDIVVATGKIDYSKTKDLIPRFQKIHDGIHQVLIDHAPDRAVIEQSVYIQNFQSSRVLSYIIGCAMSCLIQEEIDVEDVNPLIWKNGIGYKNVTKQDQVEIEANGESGNQQAKLKKERKERVRNIVSLKYGNNTPGLEDDDIVDALGIAMWYHIKTGGLNGK